MIRIKKVALLLVACSLFALVGTAQTSLNIYPVNNTFGLKFGADNKLSSEFRLKFQVEMSDASNNVYVNPENLVLYNFSQKEHFHFYTGVGIGVNFFNKNTGNFYGKIPLGGTYYFSQHKRIALVAEGGVNLRAVEYLKLNSYALIGVQIRLSK